ncbi:MULTISPECIES: hypothetical protein [Silvimonas]|uniref:hypothetical protein n=1 Tax=Silvimonas TaxID=300264 RepID=UPI0024B389D7|nr:MULTISPECIES: hypothetical protein [Silvimonas]MDR3426602.1 hypothetical protein [Silvimonas sp.]
MIHTAKKVCSNCSGKNTRRIPPVPLRRWSVTQAAACRCLLRTELAVPRDFAGSVFLSQAGLPAIFLRSSCFSVFFSIKTRNIFHEMHAVKLRLNAAAVLRAPVQIATMLEETDTP